MSYLHCWLVRTTCIKAPKWPPTKLTHIVMNKSCVVPLTETGMGTGDITFGDKMVSKVMTLKPFSLQENYIVVVYVCILLLYFSFLKV